MAYEIRNPELVNHYSLETLQGLRAGLSEGLGRQRRGGRHRQ